MSFNLDELRQGSGNATELAHVFDETQGRGGTWENFHEVLDTHRSSPSDAEVELLHDAGDKMEGEGQDFPVSFAELTTRLRDKL